MLKNSGKLSVSTSNVSTSCVKAVFLPTTSPPKAVFGGDKREGAGVENYFFNSLLAEAVISVVLDRQGQKGKFRLISLERPTFKEDCRLVAKVD